MPGRMKGSKIVQVLVAVILPPILFSIVFASRVLMLPPSPKAELPEGPYPGDDVIPDAVMIYDQTRVVNATPAAVWPWVQQVGKGRGGWYTPKSWEKYLPKSWNASRTVNPDWQHLKPGDRVEDYGFSADDYFIVSSIQPPQYLVYKSDRYGASFSWALILHDISEPRDSTTLIHRRFRGKIAATGLKRKLLVWGGGLLDHWTTAPMLAGMQERAESQKSFCDDRCPGSGDLWCRRVCESIVKRAPKPFRVIDYGHGN